MKFCDNADSDNILVIHFFLHGYAEFAQYIGGRPIFWTRDR
jgi:hypothetical protein